MTFIGSSLVRFAFFCQENSNKNLMLSNIQNLQLAFKNFTERNF